MAKTKGKKEFIVSVTAEQANAMRRKPKNITPLSDLRLTGEKTSAVIKAAPIGKVGKQSLNKLRVAGQFNILKKGA